MARNDEIMNPLFDPLDYGELSSSIGDIVIQQLISNDPKTLTVDSVIIVMNQLSQQKEKELLAKLNLDSWLLSRESFACLFCAVRDRQHFLQLFSQTYFAKWSIQYSTIFPTGKINPRVGLIKSLELLEKNEVAKIDLIDRLTELDYFSKNFFLSTISGSELEYELQVWPKMRRSELVNMPGNFFRYYVESSYYSNPINPDSFFKYVSPLKRAQLVSAFEKHKNHYFTYGLKDQNLVHLLYTQNILSSYVPSKFFGRFFTNRTPDHVNTVKIVLNKIQEGHINTAIEIVSAVLQGLRVLPSRGGLYLVLLYIAETNYVSLDSMIEQENARRNSFTSMVP